MRPIVFALMVNSVLAIPTIVSAQVFQNTELSRNGTPGFTSTASGYQLTPGTFAVGIQSRYYQGSSFVLDKFSTTGVSAYISLKEHVAFLLQGEITRSSLGSGGLDWSPGVMYYFDAASVHFAVLARAQFLASARGSYYQWNATGMDSRFIVSRRFALREAQSLTLHANAGFSLDNTDHLYGNAAISKSYRANSAVSFSHSVPASVAVEYQYKALHAAMEFAAITPVGATSKTPTTLVTPNLAVDIPIGLTVWLAAPTRLSQAESLNPLPPWQALAGVSFAMVPGNIVRAVIKPNLYAEIKDANNGGGLAAATIVVGEGNGIRLDSDTQGHVALPTLAPGRHVLHIEHSNYQSAVIDVEVDDNGLIIGAAGESPKTSLNVMLKPIAAPAVVQPTPPPPPPAATPVVSAAPLVVKEGKLVLREQIHFETGKSIILRESYGVLDLVLQFLTQHPKERIRIGGHTDNEGSSMHNRVLSLERVESVKAYLVKRGIAASRLETRGFGDSRPIASNNTPQGRAANRRVEFNIIKN